MTDRRRARALNWRCCVFLELLFYLAAGGLLLGYGFDCWRYIDSRHLNGSAGLWEIVATLSWRSLAWFMSAWGAMFVYAALSQWLVSAAILGRDSARIRKLMPRLLGVSRNRDKLRLASHTLPWIAGVFVLLWLATGEWHLLLVAGFPLCVRFWMGIRFTRPPAVLLLGASDSRSIERFAAFRHHLRPLRVICLLDMSTNQTETDTGVLEQDCLRTGNDRDWEIVIHALIDECPIIVIDGDVETPGVVREARYLASQNCFGKTIVISSHGAGCALLGHADVSALVDDSKTCVIEDGEAVPTLIHMLAYADIPAASRNTSRIISYLRGASHLRALREATP